MVLAGGQWIFIIALLPSVFGKDKPALSTSLLTGAVLSVFALTFVTLSLWVSAVSTELTSFTWLLLAFQKYRAGKNRP
jgi:hypothetical protein